MQLNRATDYAFRVVLFLSQLSVGTVVRGPEIAAEQEIPSRFLLKIMHALNEAGIIKSFRGVEGGYALIKPPEKISLYDVVEALEGPVTIQQCLKGKDYCIRQLGNRCPVHEALAKVQATLIGNLESITFAALAQAETKERGG